MEEIQKKIDYLKQKLEEKKLNLTVLSIVKAIIQEARIPNSSHFFLDSNHWIRELFFGCDIKKLEEWKLNTIKKEFIDGAKDQEESLIHLICFMLNSKELQNIGAYDDFSVKELLEFREEVWNIIKNKYASIGIENSTQKINLVKT